MVGAQRKMKRNRGEEKIGATQLDIFPPLVGTTIFFTLCLQSIAHKDFCLIRLETRAGFPRKNFPLSFLLRGREDLERKGQ